MQANLSIKPGLRDPILDSQRIFRTILKAMSEPGIILPANFEGLLEGLIDSQKSAQALFILLCLCDFQTKVWLSPSFKQYSDYVSFHTGAIHSNKEDADFLFVENMEELPRLKSLKLGSETRPDLSGTLILNLSGSGGGRYEANGPGIDGTIIISDIGLPSEFVRERNTLLPLFPQGIDFILTFENQIMGLPRTTRLKEI